MSLLGDATVVAARIGRTKANALTVELKDGTGAVIASAKQRGSAGVLFGFKNGGKATYDVKAGDTTYALDVAGPTSTLTRDGTPLVRIVPLGGDSGCRFEDGGGTTLATMQPHVGVKGDDPWRHAIVAADGSSLGTLALARSHATFGSLYDEIVFWDVNVTSLKAPSGGVRLDLERPVQGALGDALVAACIDMGVLPRGYVAKG